MESSVFRKSGPVRWIKSPWRCWEVSNYQVSLQFVVRNRREIACVPPVGLLFASMPQYCFRRQLCSMCKDTSWSENRTCAVVAFAGFIWLSCQYLRNRSPLPYPFPCQYLWNRNPLPYPFPNPSFVLHISVTCGPQRKMSVMHIFNDGNAYPEMINTCTVLCFIFICSVKKKLLLPHPLAVFRFCMWLLDNL